MLSDEEEAIEWLKRLVKINKRDNLDDTFAEILLNLIEKQSKEIEELKEDKYGLEEEVQMQAKNIMLCESALCEIQDKIKAKIEEIEVKLENYSADKINIFSGQTYMEKFRLLGALYVLQSLLEKE